MATTRPTVAIALPPARYRLGSEVHRQKSRAGRGPSDRARHRANLGDRNQDRVPQKHTNAAWLSPRTALPSTESDFGDELRHPRCNHPTPSQGEEQATGGNEISIEALEQRQQGCRKNDIYNPPRPERLLECNCGHEPGAGQTTPWSHERNRRTRCWRRTECQSGSPSRSRLERSGRGMRGLASSAALPTDSNPVMK